MVQLSYRIIFQTSLLIVIGKPSVHVKCEEKCFDKRIGKFIVANCSNLELLSIPFFEHNSIQILDISSNPITKIENEKMGKYVNLRNFTFYMGKPVPVQIDNNAFSNLTILRSVDMENITLTDNSVLIFSPSLKILRMKSTGLYQNSLDVSYLPLLRHLIVPNNSFWTIPELHKTAPIYLIDVTDNPIKNISGEKISNYCDLEFIIYDVPSNLTLNEQYCECQLLYNWIKYANIKGIENWNSPICMQMTSEVEYCNDMKIDSLKKNYNECINRKNKNDSSYDDNDYGRPVDDYENVSLLPYIILGLFLIGIAVVIGFGIYTYKKRENHNRKQRRLLARKTRISLEPTSNPTAGATVTLTTTNKEKLPHHERKDVENIGDNLLINIRKI